MLRPLILVAGSVTSKQYARFRISAMRDESQTPVFRRLLMFEKNDEEYGNVFPNFYSPDIVQIKSVDNPQYVKVSDLHVERIGSRHVPLEKFDKNFYDETVGKIDSWMNIHNLRIYGFVSSRMTLTGGFYEKLRHEFGEVKNWTA